MPVLELPMALWLLLGAILLLLLLVWFSQMSTSSRLRRIEEQLGKKPHHSQEEGAGAADTGAESGEQTRLFQEFMMEDPKRAGLPKKEQFAAFRKWRAEKGLNWNSNINKSSNPT
ncbi:hypothetical protein [Haloferula sp.]|uniref:hypothetical protein n=1 Tax=Haloferula sp. TaxID=2497595 RepID=UPI003C733BAC